MTNIGATISMMGLMLAIMVFVQYVFTGYILFILMVPALFIVIFGYILIVKDHLDNKKKARTQKGKEAKSSEEE